LAPSSSGLIFNGVASPWLLPIRVFPRSR
jgi:hypothetical protein